MTRKFSQAYCAVLCVAAMLFIVLPTLSVAQSSVRVYREVKHDTSLPLADLIRMTPDQPNPFSPRVLDILPTGHDQPVHYTQAPDEALQEQSLPQVSATLGLNFDGLGLGFSGFGICCAPPDTEGVVGATQYVQWVNLSFAVFNKTTGALVAGPTFVMPCGPVSAVPAKPTTAATRSCNTTRLRIVGFSRSSGQLPTFPPVRRRFNHV